MIYFIYFLIVIISLALSVIPIYIFSYVIGLGISKGWHEGQAKVYKKHIKDLEE